jgi:hypothetical protein
LLNGKETREKNMDKPKMIVLADIGSLRVTCAGFKQLIANLQEKFNVVTCRFYSYVAKRNRDYNEYIAANGYNTSLPSASRRRNKLDSRQVMDAYEIAKLANVDAVAMMSGEGDILPIVNLLKSRGIDVYEMDVREGRYTEVYSGFIKVDGVMLREGYTAPATKKAEKKVNKPVHQAAPTAADSPTQMAAIRDILAKYKK